MRLVVVGMFLTCAQISIVTRLAKTLDAGKRVLPHGFMCMLPISHITFTLPNNYFGASTGLLSPK